MVVELALSHPTNARFVASPCELEPPPGVRLPPQVPCSSYEPPPGIVDPPKARSHGSVREEVRQRLLQTAGGEERPTPLSKKKVAAAIGVEYNQLLRYMAVGQNLSMSKTISCPSDEKNSVRDRLQAWLDFPGHFPIPLPAASQGSEAAGGSDDEAGDEESGEESDVEPLNGWDTNICGQDGCQLPRGHHGLCQPTELPRSRRQTSQ